jgi:hypothetical protein
MQSHLRTQFTYYSIKKSKISRIFKELKNVTLMRSPDHVRDDGIKQMTKIVNTYIVEVQNIKYSKSRQPFNLNIVVQKVANFESIFEQKEVSILCKFDALLFAHVMAIDSLAKSKVVLTNGEEKFSSTSQTTEEIFVPNLFQHKAIDTLPQNLPVGIDLKTF